jgi:hypothetical protein
MSRARCLWLRPDIMAEGLAKEGGQTRSAFLDCLRKLLRNRAPAGTNAQSLSVEERLQLL